MNKAWIPGLFLLLEYIIKAMTLILEALLTFVPGAQTPPKMLTHFHRAWAGSGKLNQSPAGSPVQPRGKRSAWNGNHQTNFQRKIFRRWSAFFFNLGR
jgi:hypothetical protein